MNRVCQAKVLGNWILCTSGEDGFQGRTLTFDITFYGKSVTAGLYWSASCSVIIKFIYITSGFYVTLSRWILATVSIWPLMSLSAVSVFVVSITLAPSLILTSKSSPPVTNVPLDNTLSMSCFVTFDGSWPEALTTNKGLFCPDMRGSDG